MAKDVALTDVIVELHVPDFEKVKDFYGKLGFKEVWEYPPKDQSGYLVMQRKNAILGFFCGNDDVYNHSFFKRFPKDTPRGYGTEIAIYISGMKIDDYYKEVIGKIDMDSVVQPLIVKPWGSKDFRLTDPFGYYLCIREAGNVLHK
jgi:catechol 2,3-dioxygenase-like lactoylglutathione lyase family enzyme